MPTFTRKYLKDKNGNYIAISGLADMIHHADGETTEEKIQLVEQTLGSGTLSTTAQNVVDGINEIADEVIAARTDTTSTYDTLDARLDAMDVKIALASGGSGTIDLSAYQTKEDTNLQTNSKQVVGAINELKEEFNNYLPLAGGDLSGNIVFDNNTGIGSKDTGGNTEWLLYLNPSDKVVVGTNSNELSVHGTSITLHGTTEASQKVTFHGGTVTNNNVPHTGKRVDDSIVELIYVSAQDHVRVGSYNSPAPLILNSSQDILFENTDTRTTTSVIHSGGGVIDGAMEFNGATNFDDRLLLRNTELKWWDSNSQPRTMLDFDTDNAYGYGADTFHIGCGNTNYIHGELCVSNALQFNNNNGIIIKNTSGVNEWCMYMDTNNQLQVGSTNSATIIRTAYTDVVANIQGTQYRMITSKGGTLDGDLYTNGNLYFNVNNKGLCFTNNAGGRVWALYVDQSNNVVLGSDNTPIQITSTINCKHINAPNGDIKCNTLTQTSDQRYKSDIRNIDDNIFYDMIKNNDVHSYILNYDGLEPDAKQEDVHQNHLHVGVIAQEMAQHEGGKYILNTTINEDGEEEYSVGAYNLASAVMAALKVEITKREELEQEKEILKEQVDNLQATNQELMTRLELIEQQLGL